MKAVVAAFNQEKALVGAFSVITNLWMELFEALATTDRAGTAGQRRGNKYRDPEIRQTSTWNVFTGLPCHWHRRRGKWYSSIRLIPPIRHFLILYGFMISDLQYPIHTIFSHARSSKRPMMSLMQTGKQSLTKEATFYGIYRSLSKGSLRPTEFGKHIHKLCKLYKLTTLLSVTFLLVLKGSRHFHTFLTQFWNGKLKTASYSQCTLTAF